MAGSSPGQSAGVQDKILGEKGGRRGEVKVILDRYAGKNPRSYSWEDYGIDKARYAELKGIIQSGLHDDIALSAALKVDRAVAGHILLSASKSLPYEYVEYHDRLGRCSLGRTDFYAARRLFFHFLDAALRAGKG